LNPITARRLVRLSIPSQNFAGRALRHFLVLLGAH
jgi:hypothetical protein